MSWELCNLSCILMSGQLSTAPRVLSAAMRFLFLMFQENTVEVSDSIEPEQKLCWGTNFFLSFRVIQNMIKGKRCWRRSETEKLIELVCILRSGILVSIQENPGDADKWEGGGMGWRRWNDRWQKHRETSKCWQLWDDWMTEDMADSLWRRQGAQKMLLWIIRDLGQMTFVCIILYNFNFDASSFPLWSCPFLKQTSLNACSLDYISLPCTCVMTIKLNLIQSDLIIQVRKSYFNQNQTTIESSFKSFLITPNNHVRLFSQQLCPLSQSKLSRLCGASPCTTENNSSSWGLRREGVSRNIFPHPLELTRPITFIFSLLDEGTIEDCSRDSEVPQAATHLWPTME